MVLWISLSETLLALTAWEKSSKVGNISKSLSILEGAPTSMALAKVFTLALG